MKKLYVVSTYYHALISCVKQLLSSDKSDIICTSYIPDGKTLSEKIKKSGIFDKTYYIDKIKEYNSPNKLDYIFFYHKKNAETIERQFKVDLSIYSEINIFHDNTWFAHYLKDKKIDYRLIEDALDSFKNISKSNFAFMLNGSRIKYAIKSFFRIGYVYCGCDKHTVEVEVNDKKELEIVLFAKDKIVEIPRKTMFNLLSSEQIAILRNIFLKEITLSGLDNAVLILTRPYTVDKTMQTEREQLDYYRNIIHNNLDNDELIYIKPHPRDEINYFDAFPEAIILDKNMPVEILFIGEENLFKKVISESNLMI